MKNESNEDIRADIKLDRISVTRLVFEANEDFKPGDTLPVEFNFDLSKDLNEDKTLLYVRERLDVVFPGRKPPFDLQVAVEGVFHIDNPQHADQLERFADVGAPAILFPYLREVVDDITGKSRFPRLTLPLVNFGLAAEEKKSQDGKKR